MSGIITTLKRENFQNLPTLSSYYNYIYPVTILDAIYDNNGNQIKINFEEINNKLGLLEEKLNSIQSTQSTINQTLNDLNIANNQCINTLNVLENRLSSLEELRQNVLSTATVYNDTIINSIKTLDGKFNNHPIIDQELKKIYDHLSLTFPSFIISSTGFLLTIINNACTKYLIAILKNNELAFYDNQNWLIIEYKTI